jgi:hypothetical protein
VGRRRSLTREPVTSSRFRAGAVHGEHRVTESTRVVPPISQRNSRNGWRKTGGAGDIGPAGEASYAVTWTQLERGLTPESLQHVLKLLDRTPRREIDLDLPKWKMEAGYDLVPAFKALGMTLPFKGGDFSGVWNESQGDWISQIQHRAVLQVDEQGSEAAAVTMMGLCIGDDFEEVRRFYVDRPFMFLIRHNESGTIMFMGRVVDPTK